MLDVQAMILAGGGGTRLGVLAQKRAKPALSFGGKYRIIDFVLSNCANSGLYDVGILTQYQSHSLNDYVRSGRPWDLERKLSGGVTLLPPYLRGGGSLDWYRGTADAIYQNLDFIEADTVLVLSSDHVYKMDYAPLLRYHQESQADVTICATHVPLEKASRFGILVTDKRGRVTEFQEKPRQPRNTLVSMGIYVFRSDVLKRRLTQDARLHDSSHDFGKDVLPRMLELGHRLYAYPFQGYWVDVGTVPAYWKANMDLLLPDPPLNLLDRRWSVHTRDEDRPPVNICPGAAVFNSFLTNGCIIEGQVENSVLSPGVHVRAGALVRHSVILNDCEIAPGATVDRAILDENVVVGEGVCVGSSQDEPDLDNDITLIGQDAHLLADLRADRNHVGRSDATKDGFATDLVQRVGSHSPGIAFEPVFAAQGR